MTEQEYSDTLESLYGQRSVHRAASVGFDFAAEASLSKQIREVELEYECYYGKSYQVKGYYL